MGFFYSQIFRQALIIKNNGNATTLGQIQNIREKEEKEEENRKNEELLLSFPR